RDKIRNKNWEHRPDRRGAVPYRNKDVRNKFKQGDRSKVGNKDFRGFDKDKARSELDRSKIESKLKDGDRGALKDRAGDAGGKLKDRAGDAGGKVKDRAGDRKDGGRDIDR